MNILDIEVPLIAAVNGPVRLHSEYILLAGIVLATPSTVFQDKPHFEFGVVPGDGVNLLWQEVIGSVRGRCDQLRVTLDDAGFTPDFESSSGRETDSPLEEAGFELFVPLGISASQSWWSRARKPHGAPEGSFSVAGPIVRIHLPPGESPQTIGSAGDFARLIPIMQNHAVSIVKFLCLTQVPSIRVAN
jgi:hypothetical protein